MKTKNEQNAHASTAEKGSAPTSGVEMETSVTVPEPERVGARRVRPARARQGSRGSDPARRLELELLAVDRRREQFRRTIRALKLSLIELDTSLGMLDAKRAQLEAQKLATLAQLKGANNSLALMEAESESQKALVDKAAGESVREVDSSSGGDA